MPANLPPQYFEAEKIFRAAKTNPEKITALEEMLAIMPKHKGTDHLRAELRRRIAKLSQTMDKKSATQRASLLIQKEGAAQVLVIGVANAGKSQLVGSVTNASPAVAEYPFTTITPSPGMMAYENVQIQLIDTPPFMYQSNEAWLPSTLNRCDAILIVIDLNEDPLAQMETILEELFKMRTGIGIESGKDEQEERIAVQKKVLIAGNKVDLDSGRENYRILLKEYGDRLPVIAMSATGNGGLEKFKKKLFETLKIIRVYTKAPGGKPDFADPIILDTGGTMQDAATDVHKDFKAKLKYARVWGSGKHDGLMVKRDHVLQDGDIIELHI